MSDHTGNGAFSPGKSGPARDEGAGDEPDAFPPGRALAPGVDATAPMTPPPLDVDERGEAVEAGAAPIPLGEGDVAPESGTADEPLVTHPGDAEEARSDAPPDDLASVLDDRRPDDEGDAGTLPPPPNVPPRAGEFVPLQPAGQEPAAEDSPAANGRDVHDGRQGWRGVVARFARDKGDEAPPPPLGETGGAPAAGTGTEADPETAQAPPVPPLRERLGARLRDYLDPRAHLFSTVPHRWVTWGMLLLAVAALLGDSAGLALVFLSSLLPLLILITITQHDVFEKESSLIVAGVTGAGLLAGVVISALAAWIQGEQWFDGGMLNYGAGGFGGQFAERAGAAPVVVWLLVGILLPAVAVMAFGGIPIALRRWPQFRNEIMDGLILGGGSAAGFAIGASLVYWWPMIGGAGPRTSVREWTLAILGVAVLRPVVITLCGAMIGGGVWRYMSRTSSSAVLAPVIGGVGGFLLLGFGSMRLQPVGMWAELLWTFAVLLLVFVVYRTVLDAAVATDMAALGDERNRIVCPACHKVTPRGQFCAHCGQPLQSAAEVAP